MLSQGRDVGSGAGPDAVHERILRAFDSHVGDEPLRDDLTLLIAARLPPIPVFKTPDRELAEAAASN